MAETTLERLYDAVAPEEKAAVVADVLELAYVRLVTLALQAYEDGQRDTAWELTADADACEKAAQVVTSLAEQQTRPAAAEHRNQASQNPLLSICRLTV